MAKGNVFSEGYSKYYNLLYADKDYKAEVDYIHRTIKKYSPDARSVIEYGSGTGNHGVLLQSLGYEMVGVERSAEMANVAKSRGYNCIVSDITDFKLDGKFDVCLALFHVISYINDNESLLRLFRNTKEKLNEGGIFLFDVWFTPAVLTQVPEVRIKRLEDKDVKIVRLAEPVINHIKNTVDVNYTVMLESKHDGVRQEFQESHPMRHFGYQEIDLLARETGFEVLKAEEFLTRSVPGSSTWGVSFILKSN